MDQEQVECCLQPAQCCLELYTTWQICAINKGYGDASHAKGPQCQVQEEEQEEEQEQEQEEEQQQEEEVEREDEEVQERNTIDDREVFETVELL